MLYCVQSHDSGPVLPRAPSKCHNYEMFVACLKYCSCTDLEVLT